MENAEKEKILEAIVDLAKNRFGKNNVFLQTGSEAIVNKNEIESFFFRERSFLFIKWDFITITNSKGVSHEIRDLYVAIPVNRSGFFKQIIGFRGVVSRDEYNSKYAHSHLLDLKPGNFCTGKDLINDLWSELKLNPFSDLLTTENKNDLYLLWEGFLDYLNSFVRFESLEGKPYKYIKYIGTHNSSVISISSDNINEEVKRIIDQLDLSQIEISIDFNEMSSEIIMTESLETELAMYTRRVFHQRKLVNGNLSNIEDKKSINDIKSNIYYSIQGVVYQIDIEKVNFKENEEKKEQFKRYCNEKVTKLWKEKYEEEINKRLNKHFREKTEIKNREVQGSGGTSIVRQVDLSNYVRVSEVSLT